ncbi:ABC transporter ATP-binding protein [Pseudoclavibacter chungangensis]|uniref:ABC transporter ATP-binding protein n=1 Tax=Pseudoclavibacter chungangensis TaxID=587635 RepID=A0A7J5BQS0_9MICO|nr:ABC transporter ATP-binding protein [Pseudoclavibacter chungangensis]KAB1654051.1 ABC transporter ATP-binding protein [Pseudoclavibacter chungangensis]NYJ66039.1 peptide/nickel transport system ATP-binding protein [Pseudoclavibacter chungangensis]
MSEHDAGAPGPADGGDVGVVDDLVVTVTSTGTDIVRGVDLRLRSGRILGLVGESGSGKTTTGTALLGYARRGAAITGGTIRIAGHDVRSLSPAEVRRIRGVDIGYVPQDPSSALNPAIRIGRQLREALDLHDIGTPAEREERIREIMPEVGLPADDQFLARYPHQLSGGQAQRVALAMVFLPRPRVLVLDEPTTGLDVTTQGRVLATLDELCDRFDVAALYVTHDLAVVATIADEVAVMHDGVLVETNTTRALFQHPQHGYTRALVSAIPRLRPSDPTLDPTSRDDEDHSEEPRAVRAPLVLRVCELEVSYGASRVVHGISFDVREGEIVALVGGSGSGKTTTSRAVGGLLQDWRGEVLLGDEALAPGARHRQASQPRALQYIFQNPYQSLNPRRTVEQILRRPLELFGLASGRAARDRTRELLADVQLDERLATMRTDRLSGGERQRVAIARALAAEPRVLVCDEITSALDVSIQRAIIDLLLRLRDERGIAMLFVTHDLALVRTIADRVLVLENGALVESGPTEQVLGDPQAPYTRELVANTPSVDRAFAT